MTVLRIRIAIGSLLLAGLFGVGIFPPKDLFVAGSAHYSTAELALEESWIKGAAPILAANFESVSIVNLNKDVTDSFVFDVALSEIYQINTDYQLPPTDLRELALEDALMPYTYEKSEVFCNHETDRYCLLILAWDESSTGEFTAVRITEDLYGIVADNLLERLVK
jgi:hypothetical protein